MNDCLFILHLKLNDSKAKDDTSATDETLKKYIVNIDKVHKAC